MESNDLLNNENNSLKTDRHIVKSKIKMIGHNWILFPITKIHKTQEFITGWKLQFTYDSEAYYKNICNIVPEIDPIIITTKIIEADIDRKDGYSIFKTISGFYYMVKDINKEFYKNHWINESPDNLLHKLQTSQLISHTDIEDLSNLIETNQNKSTIKNKPNYTYCIKSVNYIISDDLNESDSMFSYFDNMISEDIKKSS